MNAEDHPHGGSRVAAAGVPLEQASTAAILIHGRGASPEDILSLTAHLDLSTVAYLAPQAAGHSWYPHSFLAPLSSNQPWLDSALRRLDELVAAAVSHGLLRSRIFLLGFSQGACLALEYAARNATRYAGVAGLSGGLIGPALEPDRYNGSFDGTPVFLGCSDVDPHIPLERVHATADHLRGQGADVDARIYPGMGHLVNRDELDAVANLLKRASN